MTTWNSAIFWGGSKGKGAKFGGYLPRSFLYNDLSCDFMNTDLDHNIHMGRKLLVGWISQNSKLLAFHRHRLVTNVPASLNVLRASSTQVALIEIHYWHQNCVCCAAILSTSYHKAYLSYLCSTSTFITGVASSCTPRFISRSSFRGLLIWLTTLDHIHCELHSTLIGFSISRY